MDMLAVTLRGIVATMIRLVSEPLCDLSSNWFAGLIVWSKTGSDPVADASGECVRNIHNCHSSFFRFGQENLQILRVLFTLGESVS